MGQIINGTYYPMKDDSILDGQTIVYKQASHAQQRKDNARNIVQPYRNGKPNPDFLEAFPKESKEVYGFLPNDDKLKGL